MGFCFNCGCLQQKLNVSLAWNRFYKEKLINYDDKLQFVKDENDDDKKRTTELQGAFDELKKAYRKRSQEWEKYQEQLKSLYIEIQPLRKKLEISEKKNAQQEKLLQTKIYAEESSKIAIEQLQAKIADLNALVNPNYISSLEKKLKVARGETKKLKIDMDDKRKDVEELRSYITNMHLQIENLSKKLLWTLQLATKYAVGGRESTSEWTAMQIQTRNIIEVLKTQYNSFHSAKKRELNGRKLEISLLPTFSKWVVDFERCNTKESPENTSTVQEAPKLGAELEEEANQLEKLLASINVEEVFDSNYEGKISTEKVEYPFELLPSFDSLDAKKFDKQEMNDNKKLNKQETVKKTTVQMKSGNCKRESNSRKNSNIKKECNRNTTEISSDDEINNLKKSTLTHIKKSQRKELRDKIKNPVGNKLGNDTSIITPVSKRDAGLEEEANQLEKLLAGVNAEEVFDSKELKMSIEKSENFRELLPNFDSLNTKSIYPDKKQEMNNKTNNKKILQMRKSNSIRNKNSKRKSNSIIDSTESSSDDEVKLEKSASTQSASTQSKNVRLYKRKDVSSPVRETNKNAVEKFCNAVSNKSTPISAIKNSKLCRQNFNSYNVEAKSLMKNNTSKTLSLFGDLLDESLDIPNNGLSPKLTGKIERDGTVTSTPKCKNNVMIVKDLILTDSSSNTDDEATSQILTKRSDATVSPNLKLKSGSSSYIMDSGTLSEKHTFEDQQKSAARVPYSSEGVTARIRESSPVHTVQKKSPDDSLNDTVLHKSDDGPFTFRTEIPKSDDGPSTSRAEIFKSDDGPSTSRAEIFKSDGGPSISRAEISKSDDGPSTSRAEISKSYNEQSSALSKFKFNIEQSSLFDEPSVSQAELPKFSDNGSFSHFRKSRSDKQFTSPKQLKSTKDQFISHSEPISLEEQRTHHTVISNSYSEHSLSDKQFTCIKSLKPELSKFHAEQPVLHAALPIPSEERYTHSDIFVNSVDKKNNTLMDNETVETARENDLEMIKQIMKTMSISPLRHSPYKDTDSEAEGGIQLAPVKSVPKKKGFQTGRKTYQLPPICDSDNFVPQRVSRFSNKRKRIDDSIQSLEKRKNEPFLSRPSSAKKTKFPIDEKNLRGVTFVRTPSESQLSLKDSLEKHLIKKSIVDSLHTETGPSSNGSPSTLPSLIASSSRDSLIASQNLRELPLEASHHSVKSDPREPASGSKTSPQASSQISEASSEEFTFMRPLPPPARRRRRTKNWQIQSGPLSQDIDKTETLRDIQDNKAHISSGSSEICNNSSRENKYFNQTSSSRSTDGKKISVQNYTKEQTTVINTEMEEEFLVHEKSSDISLLGLDLSDDSLLEDAVQNPLNESQLSFNEIFNEKDSNVDSVNTRLNLSTGCTKTFNEISMKVPKTENKLNLVSTQFKDTALPNLEANCISEIHISEDSCKDKISEVKCKNNKIDETNHKNNKIDEANHKNNKIDEANRKNKIDEANHKNNKIDEANHKNNKIDEANYKNNKIDEANHKNNKIDEANHKNDKIEEANHKNNECTVNSNNKIYDETYNVKIMGNREAFKMSSKNYNDVRDKLYLESELISSENTETVCSRDPTKLINDNLNSPCLNLSDDALQEEEKVFSFRRTDEESLISFSHLFEETLISPISSPIKDDSHGSFENICDSDENQMFNKTVENHPSSDAVNVIDGLMIIDDDDCKTNTTDQITDISLFTESNKIDGDLEPDVQGRPTTITEIDVKKLVEITPMNVIDSVKNKYRTNFIKATDNSEIDTDVTDGSVDGIKISEKMVNVIKNSITTVERTTATEISSELKFSDDDNFNMNASQFHNSPPSEIPLDTDVLRKNDSECKDRSESGVDLNISDEEISLIMDIDDLIEPIDSDTGEDNDYNPSKFMELNVNKKLVSIVTETQALTETLEETSILPSFYKERNDYSEQDSFQIPNIFFEASPMEETSKKKAESQKENKKRKQKEEKKETKKLKTKHVLIEDLPMCLPQIRTQFAFQHAPSRLEDKEMNPRELYKCFGDIIWCRFRSNEWVFLLNKICSLFEGIKAPNLLSKLQPLIRILLESVLRSSPFEKVDSKFSLPPTLYKLFQIVRITELKFQFPPFTIDSLVSAAAHQLILNKQLRASSLASLTTWVISSCHLQYNKLRPPDDEECLRWGRSFLIDLLFHHKGLIHEALFAAVNSSRKMFIRIVKYRESTTLENMILWIAHYGSWEGLKATRGKLIDALTIKKLTDKPPPEYPTNTLRTILPVLIDSDADGDELASMKAAFLLVLKWVDSSWVTKTLFPLLKDIYYSDVITNKPSLENLKEFLASELKRVEWKEEDETRFLKCLKSFPIIITHK